MTGKLCEPTNEMPKWADQGESRCQTGANQSCILDLGSFPYQQSWWKHGWGKNYRRHFVMQLTHQSPAAINCRCILGITFFFSLQMIISIIISGRNGRHPIFLRYRLKKVDPAEHSRQAGTRWVSYNIISGNFCLFVIWIHPSQYQQAGMTEPTVYDWSSNFYRPAQPEGQDACTVRYFQTKW